MKKKIYGIEIECVRGDIASQEDMQAVVNAANAQLKIGGGVAGALHIGAGPGLAEECRPMAPIKPGQAVISGAHNLPNSYVIHCLGPVYGADKPEDKLLSSCYENAMLLAEKNNIESIAFPSISTGAFAYPVKEAANVAIKTIAEKASRLNKLKNIRFVLHSEHDLKVYSNALQSV